MKDNIEILAPAGSYESMRAAMNAGCDAVYIGGCSFGARAYANNLDEDALLKAINEAHIRDKRLYLTVNTLMKEEEVEEKLFSYLEKLYLEGLDAVIVQDVGVMHFIHRHFPRLPIHASTQTTITIAGGAELLRSMGVTRLVTARELSLTEIKKIRDNTDMEIETFVHGALCYCYSGQCLFSSMIGGRSGNRGRCAQPCRMPYRFYSGNKKLSGDREQYLLSPRDINTVAIIPELVEAGIDSFKIEGRMKRPEYAAGVSYIYRKYLDLYLSMGKERYEEYIGSRKYENDMLMLQDLYNRGGFSQGYAKQYHGKQMMSMSRPNHSGVLVGEVSGIKENHAAILIKEDVNAQDILEIRDQEDQILYEFTVKEPVKKGEILRTRVGRLPVKNDNNRRDQRAKYGELNIRQGTQVYRTKNNGLLNRIAREYLEKDKKLGINGILKAKKGERLMLTLSFQDIKVTAGHDVVQAAMKQPMTKDKLSAPINKLGDTLYRMEELTVLADEDVFVPVSWLNDIRREAVQLLMEAVSGAYKRKPDDIIKTSLAESISEAENPNEPKKTGRLSEDSGASDTSKMEINTVIQTMEQYNVAVLFHEITSITADYDSFDPGTLTSMAAGAKKSGKSFYVSLPHICRLAVYERLKKDIVTLIKEDGIQGFLIKNFEEARLLKSAFCRTGIQKEMILSHNMYIFNREAKEFWRDHGIRRFTAPVELNYKELHRLGLKDSELMVYGYLPLMVSVQCLHESTGSCSRCKAGEHRTDYLVDRIGKKFFVQTNCNGCYNTIYNGQCLSLLNYKEEIGSLNPEGIRLDFTLETGDEVKQVLSAFINSFYYGRETALTLTNLTTGHFKRGVL